MITGSWSDERYAFGSKGILGRLLERQVVVEEVRLVGVDVPLRRAGDLVDERLARERVVEVADLPVET